MRRLSREQPLPLTGDEELSLEDLDALFRRDGHYRTTPENWNTPDEALDEKQFFEALEICMRALPAKASRAFILREMMGMETAEICKELEITPTNCWVLLYRARMALRACLENSWFATQRTPS